MMVISNMLKVDGFSTNTIIGNSGLNTNFLAHLPSGRELGILPALPIAYLPYRTSNRRITCAPQKLDFSDTKEFGSQCTAKVYLPSRQVNFMMYLP